MFKNTRFFEIFFVKCLFFTKIVRYFADKKKIMFWENKFKEIDQKIADLVQKVSGNHETAVNAAVDGSANVDKKLREHVAHVVKSFGHQNIINQKMLSHIEDLTKQLEAAKDEVAALKKKVTALIETHHNITMFNGVLK